jgi:hypothetical protein
MFNKKLANFHGKKIIPQTLKKNKKKMCETRPCEEYAFENLMRCPRDIKQRMADGLCGTIASLSAACGDFDKQPMLESADPLKHLPELFSSSSYQSAQFVPTGMEAPKFTGTQVTFWWGLAPFSGPSNPTVCFQMSTIDSKIYGFYDVLATPGAEWTRTRMFASTTSVCLAVDKNGQVVLYPSNTVIAPDSSPTGLAISGDGLAMFMNVNVLGWKRYTSDQTWEKLGLFAPHLSTSFDGSNLCAHTYAGNGTLFCKLGDQEIFETMLPTDEFVSRNLHSAVLGSTIFLVRGNKVYTVGSSLRTPVMLLPPLEGVGEGPYEGIWADANTVWVGGSPVSYMSNDAGWTWTRLNERWVVGPGVAFADLRAARHTIQLASSASFVEDVPYPLVLHDNGLLASTNSKRPWENWFQLKLKTKDVFRTIRPETKAALSPNGRFLYTRSPEGEVKLYLNLWNDPNYKTWCDKTLKCPQAKQRYCAKFGSVDQRCAKKKSGMPVWAVILMCLAGIALLAFLYVSLSRKSVSTPEWRSFMSPRYPNSTSLRSESSEF